VGMRVGFSKYSGAGNDFIIVDDRSLGFCGDIARLCHRQWGVGADGLILLQPSSLADYKMRIFNADGKEASMCGNGLRCLTRFISSLEGNKLYHIETLAHIYPAEVRSEGVWIEFPKPQILEHNVPIAIDETSKPIYFADSGVPHAVIFVSDIEKIDVQTLGLKVRNHPFFGPSGANVNFVEGTKLRTFERGIEGETLACGTGAAAVATILSEIFSLQNPLHIKVRSSDILTFHVHPNKLEMLGSATLVFEGSIHI